MTYLVYEDERVEHLKANSPRLLANMTLHWCIPTCNQDRFATRYWRPIECVEDRCTKRHVPFVKFFPFLDRIGPGVIAVEHPPPVAGIQLSVKFDARRIARLLCPVSRLRSIEISLLIARRLGHPFVVKPGCIV